MAILYFVFAPLLCSRSSFSSQAESVHQQLLLHSRFLLLIALLLIEKRLLACVRVRVCVYVCVCAFSIFFVALMDSSTVSVDFTS